METLHLPLHQIFLILVFMENFGVPPLSNSYNISPYVALAVAKSWNSTFSILPETIIPLATETNFIANTLYSNNNEKIPVSIPAGSKVAIVCGHTNDSASTISSSYLEI